MGGDGVEWLACGIEPTHRPSIEDGQEANALLSGKEGPALTGGRGAGRDWDGAIRNAGAVEKPWTRSNRNDLHRCGGCDKVSYAVSVCSIFHQPV
jgi:hypothetical protein